MPGRSARLQKRDKESHKGRGYRVALVYGWVQCVSQHHHARECATPHKGDSLFELFSPDKASRGKSEKENRDEEAKQKGMIV